MFAVSPSTFHSIWKHLKPPELSEPVFLSGSLANARRCRYATLSLWLAWWIMCYGMRGIVVFRKLCGND